MTNNELIKHSAAVHIANNLTLNERKASNILLKNAYNALNEAETHSMSISQIARELGWSTGSKTNKNLIDALKALNRTQLEWNILHKDKKEEWGVTTLLAEAKIKNGICYYAYSPTMRSFLSSPNIYAKLNLLIQKEFKSRYGLALWETLTEALCSSAASKATGKVDTPWIPLEDFRKLMGVTDAYYDDFRRLNSKIIRPAIAEINEKSDLSASVKFQREKKVVVAVSFEVTKKDKYQYSMALEDGTVDESPLKVVEEAGSLEDTLQYFGVSKRQAAALIKQYTAQEIQEGIDILKKRIQEGIETKNPPGFLTTAIKQGWKKNDDTMSQESPGTAIAEKKIDESSLNPQWRKVRAVLRKQLGDAKFDSWIKQLELLEITKTTVTLGIKNKFSAKHLADNFQKNILAAWKQEVAGIKEVKIYCTQEAVHTEEAV